MGYAGGMVSDLSWLKVFRSWLICRHPFRLCVARPLHQQAPHHQSCTGNRSIRCSVMAHLRQAAPYRSNSARNR